MRHALQLRLDRNDGVVVFAAVGNQQHPIQPPATNFTKPVAVPPTGDGCAAWFNQRGETVFRIAVESGLGVFLKHMQADAVVAFFHLARRIGRVEQHTIKGVGFEMLCDAGAKGGGLHVFGGTDGGIKIIGKGADVFEHRVAHEGVDPKPVIDIFLNQGADGGNGKGVGIGAGKDTVNVYRHKNIFSKKQNA